MNSPVRFHQEVLQQTGATSAPAGSTGPGALMKAAPLLLTGASLAAGRWWLASGGPAGLDGLWMGLGMAGAFGAGIVLAARRAARAAGAVLAVTGGLAYTAVCGFSRELAPTALCAVPAVGLGYWLLGRFFWRPQQRAATEHRQALELNGQRFEHERALAGMYCDRDRDVAYTAASAQVQIANSHATAALAAALIASDVRGNPQLAHSPELRAMLAGSSAALPAARRPRPTVGADEVFDQDAA